MDGSRGKFGWVATGVRLFDGQFMAGDIADRRGRLCITAEGEVRQEGVIADDHTSGDAGSLVGHRHAVAADGCPVDRVYRLVLTDMRGCLGDVVGAKIE